MARFYPTNSVSSSGISSDDVTITSYDVPESKTALTSDSDDKIIQGKLKEIGSATESVGSIDNENNRVQLTVPTRGLYSLTAKLFTSFSDMANLIGLVAGKIAQGESILGVSGTYKGLGNATQSDVRTGKTFSTAELSDVPGTMAEHAGGTYKPGTSDKTVISADRYLTGDVIVKGDPNLIAANIRKNVVIFGIKGTSDGWVHENPDLYNAGNNAFKFVLNDPSLATFEVDHLHTVRQFAKQMYITAHEKVNLFKFKRMYFEYTGLSHASTSEYLKILIDIKPSLANDENRNRIGTVNAYAPINQKRTSSCALPEAGSGLLQEGYLIITIYNGDSTGNTSEAKIHRIWLSMD